jgi:O-Antigen ligase
LYTMTSVASDPPSVGRLHAQLKSKGRLAPGSLYIAGMAAATVILLLSPVSSVLLYGFPLMSLVVATCLYRRNLPLYVSLVCWLWFLTPFVRRVVDYRAGWIPATVVQLAPLLAVCAPVLWLVIDWRKVIQRSMAPLLCILATCLYATILGLINFPPMLVFQDLLNWLAPIIFALTLYRHRDEAAEMFRAFEKAFIYGTLVVAIYGVVQFFFLPAWDVLWMLETRNSSMGIAKPTEARTFSTMNGPQIMAAFLVVGLLLAFNSRRRIRFLAIPLGLLCLTLSLARSGWIAMAAGLVYLLVKMPQKQRVQIVVIAVLSVVAVLFAMQDPDLNKVLTKRFDTLSDVRDDGSFLDRMEGYRGAFAGFVNEPYGYGMGAAPAQNLEPGASLGLSHDGQSVPLGDSTLVTIMTTMGSGAGLIFLGAFLPLISGVFRRPTGSPVYTRTMLAALIGFMAESMLCLVLSGPIGFLFWASIGFCIAFSQEADQEQSLATPVVAAAA